MTGIGKPDQPRWDKVLFVIMEGLFVAWLVLMPLDAVRFHWSRVSGLLRVVGTLLLLGSFWLFFLTFRENPYLSPAIRVQTERSQRVISTGPYRYVRHPMYAAVIPFIAGTSLLLGSWYGLLSGPILVVVIAFRAVREERVLRSELPGYDAYAAQVHYRFIPHVW
jgi:protein-S-isoprenylcysteine O-methyltransferase Ste14